jgi:hypothetical protein
LIELSLTRANFPNAFELFLKIFLPQDSAVIFKPLIIHGKAFYGIFLNNAGGPFAKPDGAFRVNLIPDCNNRRKIILIGVVGFSIRSSSLSPKIVF